MFNGTTGLAVLSILAIIGLLWFHAYRSGYKAAMKDLSVAGKEFSEKYKDLDKYL